MDTFIYSYIAMYIHETGVPRCAIYIHCNLFIHLHTLQSIHLFIYLIDQKKVFGELTSVCRWWRFPCMHSRVTAVEEEVGLSSVNSGRGDRLEQRRRRRRRPAE
jgi:hypothetical protein